jgi:hypothetical protein
LRPNPAVQHSITPFFKLASLLDSLRRWFELLPQKCESRQVERAEHTEQDTSHQAKAADVLINILTKVKSGQYRERRRKSCRDWLARF